MKYFIWTLQILLAVAFLLIGGGKLFRSRESLTAEPTMAWAQDFSDTEVKLIGAAEVAGAVGLVVPAAVGIAPILTPVAATALAVLMGGAAATHLRRGESAVFPIILAVLCLIVAGGRLALRRAKGERTALGTAA